MTKKPSRTLAQRTNHSGWAKARELIEFTGHHALEAQDRALMNILYQHAHDSGKMADTTAEWSIPLADLRTSLSTHAGNDRLRESFVKLKQVMVTVPYIDDKGMDRELITSLFDFFDIPGPANSHASVHFGLPRKLQPILTKSGRWGRIKAEIVHAMSSKYSIALYEILAARLGQNKCVETLAVEEFRNLLGVPPGKLKRGCDLMQKVIKPADDEVNLLSDIGVKMEINRRGGRDNGAIVSVTMAWWKKDDDEYRVILKELNQPKFGRKERLRKMTEEVVEPTQTDIEEFTRERVIPEPDCL